MKIENQVCLLSQAKKLKELGVEQISYFSYREEIGYPNNPVPLITEKEFPKGVDAKAFNIYSAYSVAELGVMLPQDNDDHFFESHYNDHYGEWTCNYQTWKNDDREELRHINDTGGDTEAEARADMLIFLLENNLIKVEEVNNRLINH